MRSNFLVSSLSVLSPLSPHSSLGTCGLRSPYVRYFSATSFRFVPNDPNDPNHGIEVPNPDTVTEELDREHEVIDERSTEEIDREYEVLVEQRRTASEVYIRRAYDYSEKHAADIEDYNQEITNSSESLETLRFLHEIAQRDIQHIENNHPDSAEKDLFLSRAHRDEELYRKRVEELESREPVSEQSQDESNSSNKDKDNNLCTDSNNNNNDDNGGNGDNNNGNSNEGGSNSHNNDNDANFALDNAFLDLLTSYDLLPCLAWLVVIVGYLKLGGFIYYQVRYSHPYLSLRI